MKNKIRRIPYVFVGHYVVKWHGLRANSASIPPLPTIQVINSSPLTSFLSFSFLTVQSPRGGPLSQFYLTLSIPPCLSSQYLYFFLSPIRLLFHWHGSAKWTITEIQATWESYMPYYRCPHLYCTCLSSPAPLYLIPDTRILVPVGYRKI